MESETTLEWLKNNLTFTSKASKTSKPSIHEEFIRNGSTWKHIAGMRISHSIFAIYSDGSRFCAHAGDEWLDNTQPLFGYFDISLDHDALLLQLSQKYDAIAAKTAAIRMSP